MQSTDDKELLRQFVEGGSDDAFAALVVRHINLVYSVALRRVGNPHGAEEVTQAVFITLAKKAPGLAGSGALSTWLFQTTRFTAGNFIRSESRRARREQEAYVQSTLNEPAQDVWPQIAPLLEDAVAALNEKDRRAVVLRFYENRNLREVGLALEASEAAAEKRVARAVEKMRRYFSRRGIYSTVVLLTEAISAHSVNAAPVALQKSVTAGALAKAAQDAVSPTLVRMLLLTLKTHALGAALAALCLTGTAGYFVYHATHRPAAHGQPPLAIVGVGLYLGRNQATHQFEVRRVFPNSPADRAGVAPGLIVNKVGNVLAETKSIKELSQLLSGPVGTKVTVEILDTNGQRNVVELVREQFLNRSEPARQNE
jgi:RNA polymerase sigma factor (sigma-70 family)